MDAASAIVLAIKMSDLQPPTDYRFLAERKFQLIQLLPISDGFCCEDIDSVRSVSLRHILRRSLQSAPIPPSERAPEIKFY